jgi:uncharacterized protein YyaL (SSP411 family)
LHSRYLPNKVALLVDDESRAALASYNPEIGEMKPVDGKPSAYVCENFACQLPTSDLNHFEKLLA